ncbi:MAG: sigma-54 dependent transcriptional regulator, partial [Candidatus Cloacimonadota bacterium]|nr:sigma-54 dependent transcriptional regulator [Candidatus Cloacimonadota bacterium]
MNTAFRIIIIDDEFDMRDSLKELLIRENYTVDLASSGEEAINQFKKNKYDLVLSDIIMQQVDGYKLLKTIKRDNPDLPVLLITGYSSIQGAIDAIKLGADDYFTKPFDVQKIKKVIKRIRDNKVVNEKKKKLNNRILSNKFPKIIGQSKAIESLLEEIEIVAKSGVSVLIIGESGTGKELVAKAIHNSSSRSLKPFVPINCAAVPKDLLESEFFGHEKGSFSGAIKRKLGLFENAHKGTLFLDELGEMDILLQPKLLRAIESQEIRRIGGVDEIKIDVRIISSTNKILLDEIDKDNFRRDLYYRLATYKIHIPPLRD